MVDKGGTHDMERRNPQEPVEGERCRSYSGVFRALTPQIIEQLDQDMKAASARVEHLRLQVTAVRSGGEGPSTSTAHDLSWVALQEVDTAHEELRAAEEELHAQAEAIQTAQAQLDRERRISAALFELAPEAYLVTDEHGVILQANGRAATLFNLDRQLLVRKPLVALIAHEDREAFFDLLEAMGEASFRTELRVNPRGESERVWVSLSAQRAAHDSDAPRIQWLLRTIHDEKAEQSRQAAIHAQLVERVRELEAKQATASHGPPSDLSRRDSYILAEIAHELRSPLGTVAGWLHVLSATPGLDQAKRAIGGMTRSVRLMARLVDDLVEHARIQNHQVKLKLELINLLRVVVAVIEDTRPLAQLKQIRCELSTRHHSIDVHADAVRLQQVFRNIIGNAIKFTPERGSLRVSLTTIGLEAEVVISDTGRGIPREALGQIFEPFAQLNASGSRHTGLGLGLSVSRRLIELHGGSIVAESDGPGCGSTFRLRIPLAGLN
jgi:PAS domain S-box-containing protein